MPSSYVEGKQTIVSWLQEMQPRTALDIGVGCGTYAHVLAGKYGRGVAAGQFDMGNDALPEGFKDYEGAPCTMTGVEAFYPYITKYNLGFWYSTLIIADARWLDWGRLSEYEVGFCGDVLEHFNVMDAQLVLRKVRERCVHTIVSLPIIPFPQGGFGNNPFEAHVIEDWTDEKVRVAFGEPEQSWVGKAIGVYLY